MKPGKVRPIALCVFRHDERIFVTEYFDAVKDAVFYRPLGGKIEFGEFASETVVREVQEEINQPIVVTRLLGTLESIFTFNGKQGHEIALLFEGRFINEQMYTLDSVTGSESASETFTVKWVALDFFRQGEAPLYPEGLLGLLDSR